MGHPLTRHSLLMPCYTQSERDSQSLALPGRGKANSNSVPQLSNGVPRRPPSVLSIFKF